MGACTAGGATASSRADGSTRLRIAWSTIYLLLVVASGIVFAPEGFAGTETFTYDNAGRLVTVEHGDGRVSTYTLDAAGNRTNVTTALSGPPGALSIVNSSATYSEAQGSVTVTIRRSGGNTGAASVNVSLTAGPGDATVSPASVGWAHGDSADKSVTVSIVNDAVSEPSESFDVVISGATGASLGTPSTITFTITDNDDSTPPPAPASLAATPISGSQINLSWTASSDPSGILEYRVERCSGVGCSGFAQIGTSTSTSFNNTGLTQGTTYSYRVRAVDGANNVGPYSTTATAATPGPLTVNLSSTSWSWIKTGNAAPIISANVVVVASGGAGGYTYAWERVSGDASTSASAPSSASTGWVRTVPNTNATYTSTWRCKVTDSSSAFVYTASVTVTFMRNTLE